MSYIKLKVRLILPLFGVFLFFTVANAQNLNMDSLQRVLKEHPTEDTTKVNTLNELALSLLHNQNPNKGRFYAEQSSRIADKIGYLKGKAVSLRVIGLTYLQRDKKVALDYFQKALVIGERAGDKAGICNCLINIGSVALGLGDMKKCEESSKRALRIARELNDKKLIIMILYNDTLRLTRIGAYLKVIKQLHEVICLADELGNQRMLSFAYGQLGYIYMRQASYPVALEYYLSALAINEKDKDKTGVFYKLVNISRIQSELEDYDSALKTIQRALQLSKANGEPLLISTALIHLGNIYLNTDVHTALKYYQKALVVVKDNNAGQRITILTNIGSIYTDQGEFKKALRNFEEALALAHKIELKRICSEVWNKMGLLYYAQKQYNQAIDYTQKALNLAEELKLLSIQKDSHKQLSELYFATGAYDKAYLSQVKCKSLNDSLFNLENIQKIASLESSYKYAEERKRNRIEKVGQEIEIKNQKQIIFSLISVSILIFMITFTIYRSNKLRKKLLRLEIEDVNHELEVNRKAMATATLKLVRNSERDANCVKTLEKIKKNTLEEGLGDIKSMLAYYKFNSGNSNWEEFEGLFQKVHSSFYDKLNKCYPMLTPNERKLCIFLKLDMSNRHISQITFQSEEALKKARLRLRKKLELDRDTNLTSFIQSL